MKIKTLNLSEETYKFTISKIDKKLKAWNQKPYGKYVRINCRWCDISTVTLFVSEKINIQIGISYQFESDISVKCFTKFKTFCLAISLSFVALDSRPCGKNGKPLAEYFVKSS